MIYLDNSATTYPKPRQVYAAAEAAAKRYSFNSGRGGYKESVLASSKIFDVRSKAAEFFGADEQNVVFTGSCTQSVNMAVKGLVKNGGHIIISSLEHNAVSRPVHKLVTSYGCTSDVFSYSSDVETTLNSFKDCIKSNTKLAVIMQASNVFGVELPVKEIGRICREYGIILVVDAAQSAGVLPLSLNDNVDVICAPGHKGLYGMMGTGIIALSDGIMPDTIIEGGTGSRSFDLVQPDFMPDRLESGTLNNSGIIALGAGIDFVNTKTINKIHEYEMGLAKFIYNELSVMDGVTLYVSRDELKAPIVSFNMFDYSSEELAGILADKNIAVRAGFHCSPMAHNHFGTQNRGTVRVSPSVFTHQKECEFFINTLKKVK